MKISVVTPWLNHPELIADYERAVADTEVIIVDNGSEETAYSNILSMVMRLRGVLIARKENGWFAGPVNEGLARATGDIIVVLNNDIQAAPGWLELVRRDVLPGNLYGPSCGFRDVPNKASQVVRLPYVEGWCIAARREVWSALQGFDSSTFLRPYWEDVDLSFRAMTMGFGICRTVWPIRHLSNTTSLTTPGAYDHSERNRRAFEQKVRRYLSRRAA